MKFKSKIITGRAVGRQLGFPTLNFEIPNGFKLKEGVFACNVKIQNSKFKIQNFPAVLFFGVRETFNSGKALEIHILNTELTEPPESAEVEVGEKIREVKKFSSAEELKRQIKKDCSTARQILKI